MLQVYKDIRDFILDEGNKAFAKAGLPKAEAGAIVFGMIDPSRNVRDVVFAVNPESEDVDETTLGGWTQKRTVNLAVAIRGKPYDTMMELMCGYAETLRRLFMDDTSAGGRIGDVEVGETRYYPDCGAGPRTMTGAETDLTLIYREEHNDPLKSIFG